MEVETDRYAQEENLISQRRFKEGNTDSLKTIFRCLEIFFCLGFPLYDAFEESLSWFSLRFKNIWIF